MIIGEIWRSLLFLVHRRQHEQELEDELRFHAEMAGAAQFGNVVLHKEDSREAWGFGLFERPRISVTQSASCANHRCSLLSQYFRWHWESARTPRSSA